MSSAAAQQATFARQKIMKKSGESTSELEESVAKTFLEIEVASKEMQADLRDLFILSAKEIQIEAGGKKAIVIFVPYRLHTRFQKIQSRLIRELEKRFSGKHILILAQRTILSKNFTRSHPGELRPRSRTLTAVHNSILEDLVYPTQIVGKRIRFRQDGSKLLKVLLDTKDQKEVDYKLKTYAAVYQKLTNKKVEFIFPQLD